MIGLIIGLHVIVCILLILIILIQTGRGGGLVESFSGIESMFGPKTNIFLTRMTTILSIIFFITCLTLTLLSLRQSRSLMQGIKIKQKIESTQIDSKSQGGRSALSDSSIQPSQTPGSKE
ncbi:MAG: preprotein translocase subunit SecG [Candidatus Omnitrophica bacterium]|nr:preprotein translocase subunit SecG [Candidatus Omnitrophota bacterium]